MASLAHVFNHLVLPAKLPGQQDAELELINNAVILRLIQATSTLGKLAGQEQASTWQNLRQSLRRCHSLHASGRLEHRALISEFQKLKHDEHIVLYITEQNAALIVRHDVSDETETVIFEAFETSPPSAEVLVTKGALLWDFPGCAAQIPLVEFHKSSFQNALADFLEKGSMEPLKRFQAQTFKAQTPVVESRDTASPALVTHLLIPLLGAIGSSADTKVPRLRKRIRDDASIDAAELPWRRLPFWLVLRVSTQRQLQATLGNEAGRAYYKFLITTVLVELLNECPRQLAPELTMMLRAKICRRLAKLELEKSSSHTVYDHLFNMAGPFFRETIIRTTKLVESAWERFKRETTRPVPNLSLRADPQALYLSLPNSGAYLEGVLNLPRTQKAKQISWAFPQIHDSTIQQVEQFTDKYFDLAKLECKIKAHEIPQLTATSTLQARCITLAEQIAYLFTAVGANYDSNPEQLSLFILSLFTLWVRLDQYATEICPLFLQYHPVFTPELLNVLHLPTSSEMRQLLDIQVYLKNRCSKCKHHTTIFSDPDKDGFAANYVERSAKMQELLQEIQDASQSSRRAKESELMIWCEQYDSYSLSISGGTCVCTFNLDGSRSVKGCTKCWAWRVRNRMEIFVHEDFLPCDEVKASSVVFELGIPKFITAYRNATWKIFKLGYPAKPASVSPSQSLENYEPLTSYWRGSSAGITVASNSKSFCGTHYKVAKKKMKAEVSDVLFPNGLKFSYFDQASKTWVKDFDKPLTFQHLCGLYVPPGLRELVIPSAIHPPTEVDGPSSYEIVASTTKCPPNMSIHEFTAYQRLLSGKTRRWFTILTELGSSDLNFSSESTMHMLNHLATQSGPARYETGILRDTHVVFTDTSFCNRLAEQVGKRLRNITSNWREVHCMEVLITLSLRMFSLASSNTPAEKLLKEARVITLKWIARLRTDVRNATEASVAETAARYGFWAALLCRRTFSVFERSDHTALTPDELSVFAQASLALQENLLVDLAMLPPVLKSMLIRDTKMAYNVQSLISRSIMLSPESIGRAINASWTEPNNSTVKAFATWRTLASPHIRWIVSTIAATKTSVRSQVVHYNFIEGHLLVDGKPLGRLPRDIRESNEVKALFGNQHLLTYPSAELGMSYVMATPMHRHQVHFGLRGGTVIIRARTHHGLLEYIPPHQFYGADTVDLPSSLINNCRHWLNLDTNCIEVRRTPQLWKTRWNDWNIDIRNRHARRKGKGDKISSLIDPNSVFGKQVTDIFRYFEEPHKITVYQPMSHRGRLSVELRHLELSFCVNSKGLLQCQELGEEIDPNQDIGTLYGLRSKIVLRDVADNDRRCIIVPWGPISYNRYGMHVAVQAAGSTEYARFGVDDVLGRLSCPAEPRLLYAKARLHAMTSFVLPDPLTGRTGTDEALQILQSGYCQPWEPLGGSPIEQLKALEKLSPRREYYPEDKKQLQSVHWDAHLTTTIQHEAYEGLVRKILYTSERLRVFAATNNEGVHVAPYLPSHLRERGMLQRGLYERRMLDREEENSGDTMFKSRAQQPNSSQAGRVHHITKLLQAPRFTINTTRVLSAILEDWSLIGGFHTTSEIGPTNLSDLTEKNIDEQWGSLVNVCRTSDIQDFHSLMFRLSLMSLNPKADMDVIKVLAAFASIPGLKTLQPPSSSSFNHFKFNETPTVESLFRVISIDLPQKPKRKDDLAQEAHYKACVIQGRRLAQHLLDQWPNEEISVDDFESNEIDIELTTERMVLEWHRLRTNMELSEYILQVENVLSRHSGKQDTSVSYAWKLSQVPFRTPDHGAIIPSLSIDLLAKRLASPLNISSSNELVPTDRYVSSSESLPTAKTPLKETTELRKILFSFTKSTNMLRLQYGRDLEASLTALEKGNTQMRVSFIPPNITVVARSIRDVRNKLKTHFMDICEALSTDDSRFPWLDLANLWPCSTPIDILKQLRSSSRFTIDAEVKEAIISHGILLTTLQRLVRVRNTLYHANRTRLQEELGNSGHENWSPLKFPDWLLLEIDSNLLIRREQIDVAHAIIAPESRDNTVLQLNMGQGKTSCIVPMAMAILGNGDQLSRLVVPKPLLLPTAQMIQSRLGGLVGREILHIPFSRRTNPTSATLRLYMDLHEGILHRRGVLLSAPEHILSYKLSGLQHLVSSKLEIAREMVDFQARLDSICRDVLDESDVSLAVKTQLIYPSGEQITVDGHPHRWQVAQSLLALVTEHLPELQRIFPRGIEVVERDRGYPLICILQSDVEEDLHRRIIDDISNGTTTFLRFADSTSPGHRAEIHKVLVGRHLDQKLYKRVTALFADKNVASKKLLLVRGLLLNRILLLCLKKRWNVQYGLHPGRDPIAVPFEAKGVPSEQAEFGHPDAAILFTCLAFYYTGLSQSQFSEGLRHVLSSHDPSSEYDRWTTSCDTLPDTLYHWNSINVDDQGQLEELWKHLRTTRSVLDHYMNHFVFPVHAKQFGTKLQASGWDLPLFSKKRNDQQATRARTTGFSGTNDNKMLLPLTIQQDDLPSLRQTNAEVLTYLLQSRNRGYQVVAQGGTRLTETGLLEQLKQKEIRILIDAGAYILEMDNEALVKAWMDIDTEAQAAVFFGSDNRAWVKYRGTKATVPLLTTAFADNLDKCLVYFDEAHTRGVDLRLPQCACGALTLALGQTKDHTVQAAMRLRQLATTQSVCFFAFPETHQSILDVCKMSEVDRIDSADVVHWLLEQTCRANEQLQNLYIAQGADFCNRTNAKWGKGAFHSGLEYRDAYVKVLQHPEQQTLEQLYGACMDDSQQVSSPFSTQITFPQLQTFMDQLNNLRCAHTNDPNALQSSALEEVEQEREVEFQVEEVREVQPPVHYKALAFPGVHPTISTFFHTGALAGVEGYEHVYTAVARTAIGKKFGVVGAASRLFVSAEFMRTIKMGKLDSNDNFLRSVEWILYSPNTSTALILIAEEAEIIIPRLRAQGSMAKVHLLVYSAPVTKKMLHFSALKYYALPALPHGHTIPRWLTIELGIFAGRLYMGFEECVTLREYIEPDKYSKRSGVLGTKAISFLLEWLALRRKGQDIMHTPMGYVCQGRLLDSGHAFFVTPRIDEEDIVKSYRSDGAVDGSNEESDQEESDGDDDWHRVDENDRE